jgi:hypothetical protein
VREVAIKLQLLQTDLSIQEVVQKISYCPSYLFKSLLFFGTVRVEVKKKNHLFQHQRYFMSDGWSL